MTIFVGVSKKCRQNEPENKKNRTEEGVFGEKKRFMGRTVVDRNLGVDMRIDMHMFSPMTVGETAEDDLNKHYTVENENLHFYLLYIFLS